MRGGPRKTNATDCLLSSDRRRHNSQGLTNTPLRDNGLRRLVSELKRRHAGGSALQPSRRPSGDTRPPSCPVDVLRLILTREREGQRTVSQQPKVIANSDCQRSVVDVGQASGERFLKEARLALACLGIIAELGE